MECPEECAKLDVGISEGAQQQQELTAEVAIVTLRGLTVNGQTPRC